MKVKGYSKLKLVPLENGLCAYCGLRTSTTDRCMAWSLRIHCHRHRMYKSDLPGLADMLNRLDKVYSRSCDLRLECSDIARELRRCVM